MVAPRVEDPKLRDILNTIDYCADVLEMYGSQNADKVESCLSKFIKVRGLFYKFSWWHILVDDYLVRATVYIDENRARFVTIAEAYKLIDRFEWQS